MGGAIKGDANPHCYLKFNTPFGQGPGEFLLNMTTAAAAVAEPLQLFRCGALSLLVRATTVVNLALLLQVLGFRNHPTSVRHEAHAAMPALLPAAAYFYKSAASSGA